MVFRIREIRENKGITQAQLSDMSGITRATLWRLETSDDCEAKTDTLSKIADALGVPLSELFFADHAQPTKQDGD